MNIHEKYIKRCIELAKNGMGTTYPNPMVGSVVVLNNKIIGEGWHRKSGEPHAEVNAIKSVEDKSMLSEATIYVSLEPCSHFGKTPPCSHLIVEKGIKKVVVGVVDFNSEVSGKGIQYLKDNGCEVVVGVLENECYNLNKRFFTFHNKQRPYIILKWAETKDGFIDKLRNENDDNSPNWISNNFSQQLVHKFRAEEQSILVGTNTALNDNPTLNVRSWSGENPIRIVLDRNARIPKEYNLLNGTIKTIVFSEVREVGDSYKNVIFEPINFAENVPEQICDVLFKYEIQSLIIEGGKKTLQSFIDVNLWDEAMVFKGVSLFKDGVAAPEFKKVPDKIVKISNDTLCIYNNN